jgi:MYXO-CTERM domain-containing protein
MSPLVSPPLAALATACRSSAARGTAHALGALLAWATVGALALAPAPVAACGGFFCSASQPVNQAAERVLFAHRSDGRFSAIIEVQYEGPSEEFAWVIPVTGQPEVKVSSNVVLDQLQTQTNPLYTLNRRVSGKCEREGGLFPITRGSASAASADVGSGSGVSVLSSGGVGPYEWTLIDVDEGESAGGASAVRWLRDNGYDVDAMGGDVLGEYLEEGMHLLAFRLRKGASTGSIRPVHLVFDTECPFVPIRPTAVAALEDMGLMVFVAADERAVPINYMSLELNDAAIDWFNPNPSYPEVLSRAADEAGGQGFVTEFAQRNGNLDLALGGLLVALESPQVMPSDLVGLGWSGMADALRSAWPQLSATSDQALTDCPDCGLRNEELSGAPLQLFRRLLADEVLQPVLDAQALLGDTQYLTRFFTTMSPDEMTLDPMFDFNDSLPEVDNNHIATQVIECNRRVKEDNAGWRIELPDGSTVRGAGNARSWPFTTEDIPLNRKVRLQEKSGSGLLVTDNVGEIQAALEVHNLSQPRPGQCSGSAIGGSAPGWLSLALLALAARLRRRWQVTGS